MTRTLRPTAVVALLALVGATHAYAAPGAPKPKGAPASSSSGAPALAAPSAPAPEIPSAKEPTSADEDAAAAADALFREGKRLVGEQKIALACPKFAASYKLDKKLGTLLNWADCLEKDHKTGSAFVRFSEAVDFATAKGDDRLAFAKERRDALAPKVARLSLDVRRSADPLVVVRDGEVVDEAAWGIAQPVDPGTIHLEVRRGDETLERREVTAEEGRTSELRLDLAAIAKAHPPKPKGGPVPKGQRNAGFALIGVGIGGLAAFGVLEGIAWGQKSAANGKGGCRSGLCTPHGYELLRRSGDFAEAGQWTGIAGVGLLAIGTTLVLTAPRAPKGDAPRVTVAPLISPNVAGLVVGGPL